jgi:hypothetical protein
MATTATILEPKVIATEQRQALTTYDSGYEHSIEHMLDLRRAIDEADQQEDLAN